MFSFEGLAAATVTPTNEDGSINCEVIPQYISYLLKQNVKAVFVNGTTGEWPSFTVAERQQLSEAWIKHGRDKLDKIMIHCGALSIQDSKALAKHAADIGADAIAGIAPCFFRPDNEECLVDYLQEIASAAPDTPFLYYHIPVFTKVEVDMENFLNLAHERIPTFCGIKLSSHILYEAYLCLQFKKKKLTLFGGFDEQLFAALMMGAKAAVGSMYNYLGTQFNDMLDAVQKEEFSRAKDIQIRIALDMIPLHRKYGPRITKTLMSCFSGIKMGPPRLPLKPLTHQQVEEVELHLKSTGYTS